MTVTAWAWLAVILFACGFMTWLVAILIFAGAARLGEAMLKAWKEHRL